MKKVILLSTLVAAAAITVWCTQPTNTAQVPANNVVTTNKAPAAQLASTNYVPFSNATVQDAEESGKNMAIFFHSKTCGSCAKLDADIVANAKNIPDDTVILKADWDENQALAKQLKVDKYHTVAFINADGTSNNVKGLFTLDEVMDAWSDTMEKTISSNYELYTANAVLAAEKEGKDVAVFFHSKTCGSCAKLDADITANTKNIPSDTVILKADWDENQELARKLKVDKYHTVAFMNDDGTSNNVKGLFTLNDVVSAK